MKRSTLVNWLLGLAAVALVVLPLVFVEGEYAGADGQAMEIVEESHPDYQVWFSPIYEPPSEEVASGLFAMQAALGAGALGYFVGRAHGRRGAHQKTGGQPAAGRDGAGRDGAGQDGAGQLGAAQVDTGSASEPRSAGTPPEAAR